MPWHPFLSAVFQLSGVNLPMSDKIVFSRTDNMTFLDRWPTQSITNSSAKSHFHAVMTYPSVFKPCKIMSGLHSPPAGALEGCFVLSKILTSPLIAFVANKSVFWGIYRALLISPSWLIVWTTLIRGLEFVYDPSSGCQLTIPTQEAYSKEWNGLTLPFFIVEFGDILPCCFCCCLGEHDFGNHKLISPLAGGVGTE